MHTSSTSISTWCSCFPAPRGKTTDWGQAFHTSVPVLYPQPENVPYSSLSWKKRDAIAELHTTGQSMPTQLDSTREQAIDEFK